MLSLFFWLSALVVINNSLSLVVINNSLPTKFHYAMCVQVLFTTVIIMVLVDNSLCIFL